MDLLCTVEVIFFPTDHHLVMCIHWLLDHEETMMLALDQITHPSSCLEKYKTLGCVTNSNGQVGTDFGCLLFLRAQLDTPLMGLFIKGWLVNLIKVPQICHPKSLATFEIFGLMILFSMHCTFTFLKMVCSNSYHLFSESLTPAMWETDVLSWRLYFCSCYFSII